MKVLKTAATKQHIKFTFAEAKVIGEKLGIDWETFDVKQFRLGLNTERANGTYNPITNFLSDDPILVGKIVRAQLNRRPDYYTYWELRDKETKLKQGRKRSGPQSISETKSD